MGETPWSAVQASWAAAAACLGMAAWLVGGDHFGARRARLVLAGGERWLPGDWRRLGAW